MKGRFRRVKESGTLYGRPTVYVIAGPNGAGKTTFAKEFLKNEARCPEFINADLIAGGLSPLAPERAALQAGRLMLTRLRDLAKARRNFAFETTLSGQSHAVFLRRLKASGYEVHLFFLWLPDVDLAFKRIADRVRHGGHDVPETDVRRRFSAGMKNLFKVYRSLADELSIFDNTETIPRCVAVDRTGALEVFDPTTFDQIKEMAGAL